MVKDVVVATFPNELEARMSAQRLEAAGIRSVLVALSYEPGVWGTSAMLPHELRVLEVDLARAQQVLQDQPATAPPRRRRLRKHTSPEKT